MAVSTPSRRGWDSGIPIVLRPLVRAYLFGYASAAGPRLLTLLLQHVARHRRSKQQTTTASDPQPDDPFLAGLRRILLRPLSLKSFPTACAVLIGGTTFLEVSTIASALMPPSTTIDHGVMLTRAIVQLPVKSLLDRYGWTISDIARRR